MQEVKCCWTMLRDWVFCWLGHRTLMEPLSQLECPGLTLVRGYSYDVHCSLMDTAISSSLINISKDITEDITFPQIEDLVNYTNSSTLVPAAIRISSALLAERLDEQKNTGTVNLEVIIKYALMSLVL